MPKISNLPILTAPDGTDYIVVLDTSTMTTKKVVLSDLLANNALVGTSGLADSAVSTAKIADDAVTDAKLDYPRFYQEIARTTLSVAGDTITVSSIPARQYLRVHFYFYATGGTLNSQYRFNSDSGNNYAEKYFNSFATPTDIVNTNILDMDNGSPASGGVVFGTIDIINIASREKHAFLTSQQCGTGAGTAPFPQQVSQKWVNTSAQINTITVTNSGTGDFAIGSEVVVLGHD
jgi:hypothetical protein